MKQLKLAKSWELDPLISAFTEMRQSRTWRAACSNLNPNQQSCLGLNRSLFSPLVALRLVEVDEDYAQGDWVEAMFDLDQIWYPGVVEDPFPATV